jgi:hypothetical protein
VTTEPPLRVDPIHIPDAEENLESPPQPQVAPQAPLRHNGHNIVQDEAVSSPIPSPEPAPTPTVLENASPSQDPVTFHNSAGPKRRRKRTQTRRKPVKTKSPPKPGTLPPPNVTAANLEAVPAHWALHGNAFNPDTGEIAQCKELSKSSDGPHWRRGNSHEIGRLAQGLGKLDPTITGTNTFFFIDHKKVPKGRKVTYLNVVSAFRPEKKDPYCARWTVGGDQVNCPGNVSTKTADITTAKILINSVLSTPNAKLVTSDLKDFYLGAPMDRYEHMQIPLHMLPDDIMDLYELHDLVHNGCVCVEIRKGMHGLPQAGKLANDRLQTFLEPHGCAPTNIAAGL